MRPVESWVMGRESNRVLHLAYPDSDAMCGARRPAKGWAVIADGLDDIAPSKQNPCERCQRKLMPGGIG